MKKVYVFMMLMFGAYLAGFSQTGSVGIGTTTPNPSAMLDVQSTDKGMLVPRMTTAQRTAISNAATGLLVFDNTTGTFWFYNGNAWTELVGGGSGLWTQSGNNIYNSNTGNVGIGTNTATEKLQISGGNVLIMDGILARNTTGTNQNLLPIAIATIAPNGTKTDGTKNVSSVFANTEYTINIGEKNKSTQVFISLMPGAATSFKIFKLTGMDDTKYKVVLYNNNSTPVSGSFSMVVFKAGNDPLREYNITIGTSLNGVYIGHGKYGIDAYGVDSVTINITITNTVMIGGPDPDTVNNYFLGAINIRDIPCPATITINNYGKIIGRGGLGGQGGGTYQSNSPNTTECNLAAFAGRDGGHAIYTEKKVKVNNYGYMAGGGGGGGAGKSITNTSGANGGGGGTGAGWPLVQGGKGGSNFYATSALGNCPPGGQIAGCGTLPCCCGGYAPFANNGKGNIHSSGNVFIYGTGGLGINGGYQGVQGGGIALPGLSNANTSAGGLAGKVIKAITANANGNIVINLNGGSYGGQVD